MLWAAIAGLTLVVLGAVLWPLLRQRKPPPARALFDRRIYSEQLAEITRDLDRGVLDQAQAAAARLEIERRLLATESAGEPAAAARPVDGVTVASLGAAVAAAAVAIYLAIGSPGIPDEPLAARRASGDLAAAAAPHDLASAMAALAQHLKEHPDDAAGWLLLAHSDAARQRWGEAADAYRHAMALTNDGAEASAGYGEVLVMQAGGIVSPAARDAFAGALQHDPKNPSARYYMALAEAQAGRPADALAAWRALLADSPPDAPWQATVRERMRQTAQDAGLPMPKLPPPASPPLAAGGAPGPTAADIAAAQQMTPAERQQMIRGMVAGLAARLEKSPDDPVGWQRLARAYRVLGENDKAEAAEKRAAAAGGAAEDPGPPAGDVAALLGRAHALLGVAGADRDVRKTVPPAAVDLYRAVAARDPDQPEALWYLGLAAAQQHDASGAASYWQRLLGLLPKESEQRKTVAAALDALKHPD